MKSIIKILIITCWTFAQVQGQSVKEEIQKIRQAYEKSNRLSMEVTYKVFANHFSTTPIEVSTGSYKKSGNNFESNLNGLITVQSSKFLLTVDPEQESILVTNPRKATGFVEGLPLDTLLSVYTKSKVTIVDNRNRRLTLVFKKTSGEEDEVTEIEKVDFYYNSTTFLLQKLVMFYGEAMSADEEKQPQEKPRMEIVFSNVNSSPVFDKNAFSESAFLIQQGKKLIGTKQYAEYEIIDQRIKK